MTTLGDSAWTGLALVVGTGGIGSAMTARLKQQCPGLRVITAGRQGPPLQDLSLDLERDADLEALTDCLRAEAGDLRLVVNARADCMVRALFLKSDFDRLSAVP